MGVEGGPAPRLQQVKSTESWSVVCNHSSLTPTPSPLQLPPAHLGSDKGVLYSLPQRVHDTA